MESTFVNSSKMQTMASDPNAKNTTFTQNDFKRITSNLPEVYNKYFFTTQEEGKPNQSKRISKMNETSPADLKKGFSLNKTQKDSLRAISKDNPNAETLQNDLNTKQSLKQYLNKNVF